MHKKDAGISKDAACTSSKRPNASYFFAVGCWTSDRECKPYGFRSPLGLVILPETNTYYKLCPVAARTVFDSNAAIVIGPIPPGTGVIYAQSGLTASKSTSPCSL